MDLSLLPCTWWSKAYFGFLYLGLMPSNIPTYAIPAKKVNNFIIL